MSLIEEKTLADHDINVRSIRQELQLLEEQLKKHGRNEIQPSLTATDPDTVSRQPEPHWIPCSEKLPEANGRYRVTRGLVAAGALWNRVYIANYSNLMGIKSVKIWWQGNVGKSDFERIDDVIAWMPLPEPYREDT